MYKLIYGYIHGIDNVRVCDLCNKYNVIMKYDRVVDTYYILGKGTLENTFIDELRAVCSWINLTCMDIEGKYYSATEYNIEVAYIVTEDQLYKAIKRRNLHEALNDCDLSTGGSIIGRFI